MIGDSLPKTRRRDDDNNTGNLNTATVRREYVDSNNPDVPNYNSAIKRWHEYYNAAMDKVGHPFPADDIMQQFLRRSSQL